MSTPVIKSFNSGELSPLLDARSDLEKYANGCKVMENMIPLTQGAATRRSGTEYIESVKPDSGATLETPARMIKFARSNSNSYNLEWGQNYFRVYTSGARVNVTVGDLDAYSATESYVPGDWVDSGGAAYYCIQAGIGNIADTDYWIAQDVYEVWTPYSSTEVWKLKLVQSADTMYLVHPDHEVHKLTSTGAAAFTLEKVSFVYQALKDENIETTQKLGIYTPNSATEPADWVDNVNYPEGSHVNYSGTFYEADRDISEYEDYTDPSAANAPWSTYVPAPGDGLPSGSLINMKASGYTFSADDVGKYYLLKVPRTDNSITDKLTSLNDFTTPSVRTKGTWNMTTHGIWNGVIQIQRSYDEGVTWVMARTYGSTSDSNKEVDGEEQENDVLYRVQMTEYTSGTCRVDFNVEDAYYFKLYKVVKYTDTTTVTVQVDEAEEDDSVVIANIVYYSAWAQGAWGGDFGYPRSIAFFQERLCFGGNSDQSLTVWLSKIADYENLTSGVLDNDALIYTLASDKVEDIVWMVPHDKLLIGTTGDEWILGSSKNEEPMNPQNTIARRQSAYGSEDIQAITVNNVVFFVQRGARKIREMAYDYQSELYQSPDMTVMSEHITAGGIIDIQFQLNPFPILWCLRADGVLVGFTYEKEQQVYGWHRHVTQGEIKSIAVIPNGNNDELWCDVERIAKASPTSLNYIERFTAMSIPEDIEDIWFVDSGLSYDGGAPVNITVASQVSAAPFTFNIVGHGLVTGDYIRVIADPDYPTYSAAFPFLNETFYVQRIDDDNFSIKNESNTAAWTFTDHPYNFIYLRYEQVIKTVTGLLHLENLEVNVIEDHALSDNKTVAISTGIITLENYSNHVVVGLPYTSTLKPMNIETELADGGSQGRKKRISQAVIRFYLSVGCLVVSDEGEEMLVPFRKSSDPMDTSPPLKSGDLKVKYKDGYDSAAGITLKQDVPLPMTILMIQVWIRTYN